MLTLATTIVAFIPRRHQAVQKHRTSGGSLATARRLFIMVVMSSDDSAVPGRAPGLITFEPTPLVNKQILITDADHSYSQLYQGSLFILRLSAECPIHLVQQALKAGHLSPRWNACGW